MIRKSWVEDDIAYFDDNEPLYRGDTYTTGEDYPTVPPVRNPIGFIRSKPRVRIKAWTAPRLD
jgi:hypothetical protein